MIRYTYKSVSCHRDVRVRVVRRTICTIKSRIPDKTKSKVRVVEVTSGYAAVVGWLSLISASPAVQPEHVFVAWTAAVALQTLNGITYEEDAIIYHLMLGRAAMILMMCLNFVSGL